MAGTIGPRGRVRREERAERGQIEESDNSAADQCGCGVIEIQPT